MNPAMTFVDEEEALSFDVWVAQLELLVRNARGNRRVDPIYSIELLQKLQGSIRRSEKAQLQSHQRKCEDALTIVLLKGAPPPVRSSDTWCSAQSDTMYTLIVLSKLVSARDCTTSSK